jgi:hypothetical protein
MIFAVTVVLSSFLFGMISGGLICFRRWRAGLIALAVTYAATASTVATTIVTENGTARHAAALGAIYGLVPLVGTGLVCIGFLAVRFLRATIRAVVNSTWNFGATVLAGVHRVIAKPADHRDEYPRHLNKSSRRALSFLSVLLAISIGLHATTISGFLVYLAPKLPTATNILDLISFVMVTPKLFNEEAKNNLLATYIGVVRIYTLGKMRVPGNTITYSIGAMLLLCTFSLFPFLLIEFNEINFSQLLSITSQFSQLGRSTGVFDASFFDYMRGHMVEAHAVFAAMWPFFGSTMIVYIVFSISVIFFSALPKATPEDQDKLADKLLSWGVVVFLYSRALSTMG